MLLQIITTILLSTPLYAYAMDKESDTEEIESVTREQSNKNKIQFIRDVFTTGHMWEFTFAQKVPILAYRKATSKHLMNPQISPSTQVIQFLLNYATEKKINFSIPVTLYDGKKGTYIKCEDTSIHLLIQNEAKNLKHIYVPPCDVHDIHTIGLVSANWLALAGNNTITFCNIYNIKNKMRMTFNWPFTFTGISEEHGTLVCETNLKNQFIIYPYHTQLYNLLHGKELSEKQLEIMFMAAYAWYEKQSLDFTKEEEKIYASLPKELITLVDHFFPTKKE